MVVRKVRKFMLLLSASMSILVARSEETLHEVRRLVDGTKSIFWSKSFSLVLSLLFARLQFPIYLCSSCEEQKKLSSPYGSKVVEFYFISH